MIKKILATAMCVAAVFASAQKTSGPQVKYSDFETWQVRKIKESFLIGGKVKDIYEIGTPAVVEGSKPREAGDSPWETSCVYVHVAGIDKASGTVYPEKRGNGTCAKMESKLEAVKVLGMVNLSCMATGSIFTGYMEEPISNADKPYESMFQGVPFTGKPKALRFDYKATVGGKRQKITITKTTDLEGKNEAEVSVILQKRWEDANGNLHAKRVATGYMRISESTEDWVNGFELPIHYGDISKEPFFRNFMAPNYEGYPFWGKNSKGGKGKIDEAEYAGADETPTHIIIRFSSGYGGAFIGAIGDKLWVDNVELVY